MRSCKMALAHALGGACRVDVPGDGGRWPEIAEGSKSAAEVRIRHTIGRPARTRGLRTRPGRVTFAGRGSAGSFNLGRHRLRVALVPRYEVPRKVVDWEANPQSEEVDRGWQNLGDSCSPKVLVEFSGIGEVGAVEEGRRHNAEQRELLQILRETQGYGELRPVWLELVGCETSGERRGREVGARRHRPGRHDQR